MLRTPTRCLFLTPMALLLGLFVWCLCDSFRTDGDVV